MIRITLDTKETIDIMLYEKVAPITVKKLVMMVIILIMNKNILMEWFFIE